MIEYGVDTVAGPVPLPIRAKKIRPVKIVSPDGTVKRVTDTEAILPLMYRVGGLEVVTRDDASVAKIVICASCGLAFTKLGSAKRCSACLRDDRDVKTGECVDCGLVFRKLGPAKQCPPCLRRARLCACGAEKRKSATTCRACLTPERLSDAARKGIYAKKTPEQRSEASRIGNAKKTPEQRAEASRIGNAKKTPEQRAEASRKARASITPEQRSEAMRKRWAKLRAAE